MTMRWLLLLCLLEGILCDTLADEGNVSLFLENADSKHRVTRDTADQSRCTNTYEADKQLFHTIGRQWRPVNIPLKEGYVLTPGVGAHKLHRGRMNWHDAGKACREEGGDLTVLNSLAEESVVLRMIRSNFVQEAWVGIHDIFEEGEWITVTGETIEKAGFNRWTTAFANLPDNLGGAQNCGVLHKEGGIDDVVCALSHFYVCEIPIY